MKPCDCQSKRQKLFLVIVVLGILTMYVTINARGLFSKFQDTVQQSWPSPSLPERVVLSNEEIAADILTKNPALPTEFLYNPQVYRAYNSTCAHFPGLFDIEMNNGLWQHVHLSTDRELYLFSAHFDNRESVLKGQVGTRTPRPIVRLLGMTTQDPRRPVKAMCQFWYDRETRPTFSAEATFDYLWRLEWGYHENVSLVAVLISCPLKDRMIDPIPQAVTFVENACDDAKNALRVQRGATSDPAVRRAANSDPAVLRSANSDPAVQRATNSDPAVLRSANSDPAAAVPPSGSVAVCVKGLAFWYEDMSYRLVEWIELVKLLGAAKVYVYELALHPNMKKVLQYYESVGFVDTRPYTFPGGQVTSPELMTLYLRGGTLQNLLNEVIPYNDCLYRNWQLYEYVAVIDIDEIILPASTETYTWSQLISDVIRNVTYPQLGGHDVRPPPYPYSSICGRNVHFVNNATDVAAYGLPDDVPPYLYMLTRVSRDPNFRPLGHGIKCLHSTSRVLTLHNHFPFKCVDTCNAQELDPAVAHMQHYRSDCSLALPSRCPVNSTGPVLVDTTMWKYKKPLIEQCNTVLTKLDMI